MMFYWFLVFTFILFYVFLVLTFSFSWQKLKYFNPTAKKSSSLPSISVVIALRNEELNLHPLMLSLAEQSYPANKFEVILVDDHSTDNSFDTLVQYSKKHPWVEHHKLDVEKSGKKEALELGISKSRGELLSFTDADCILPSGWLNTLAQFYIEKQSPDMIIGLVNMTAKTFMQKIFKLEFLSLILTSAGAANLGHPMLCNGANIALKASALENYSFQNNVTSGDDVFLLHYLKKNNGAIEILKSSDHLVKTSLPKNLAEFLNQRKRWASKATYYKDPSTIVLALTVLIGNGLLASSIIIGIIYNLFIPVATAFGLKSLSDLYIFYKGKDVYRYQGILWWFPLISIVYPFYIVITSISSIKKPFTWKGRSYNI